MGVVTGQLVEQRRSGLGEQVGIGGMVGHEYLGHAVEFGRRFGDGADAATCHQHVDIATDRLCCRNHVGGGAGQGAIVMFREYQNAHEISSFQSTLASFLSLSTSSSTEPTLTPPWRSAGGSTLSSLTRLPTDTPRSAGDLTSSGFFLAFMMSGSLA